MDRRHFLKAAAACGLVTSTARATSALIATQQGPLEGESHSGVQRFLGIPFAAPPVGPLRFMPPQPALKRDTVLTATHFAAAPVQKAPNPAMLYGKGPFPTSEDCLYLNIWAPQDKGPHPVYVWVHGGGNVAGSSRMPVFDGTAFARAGIVCVTISYRVGALGFLELGDVLGDSYHGSGNNGLLDIVEALTWVRDNISGFGGDPRQVTLGGQSAGAKNVCTLMAMPAARGLFHRAIIESGGAQTVADHDTADRFTRHLITAAGIRSARDLLNLAPDAILSAQIRASATWARKYPFRAVIDGRHVPALPLRHADPAIPVLIGTTRDEIAFFGPDPARDGTVTAQDLANMSMETFAPIYAKYDHLYPDLSPVDRRYAALTAEEYWLPTLAFAKTHAAKGGKAYVYRLDMPRAAAPNKGYSVHGSELALVFDKVADPQSGWLGPEGPEGLALSKVMHAQWVRFIKTGTVRYWPAYEAATRKTLIFNTRSEVVADPDRAERILWPAKAFDHI